MELDPAAAWAWRLRRHGLQPRENVDAVEVVGRVLALRGWPSEQAESMVAARQAVPDPGAVHRALATGELIRSYVFRGGSYVLTHEVAAELLAVRTATRVWQTRRWQAQGGFELEDWEPLRAELREALADGPRTRGELRTHLETVPTLAHLAGAASGAGSDALYKPLHWWGDLCFGPSRDGQATFRWLREDDRWPGLPDVDEAGRRAVRRYLHSYGPATGANLGYWLTDGLGAPRRRLLGWLADLDDELVEVELAGVAALVLASDLDAVRATAPDDAVRLLPGHDPWVLGPGTADTRLLAPQRRSWATRGANLVITGGVVTGGWQLRGGELVVSWFAEAGPAPTDALQLQAQRLRPAGQHLSLTVEAV